MVAPNSRANSPCATFARKETCRSSSSARGPFLASDDSASSRFCSSGFRRTGRFTSLATATKKFQFVHAHDLMDAYMLAMDAGRPGVYNVGTNQFGTLREALDHVIVHGKSTSRVASLPAGLTINTLRVLDWLRLSPLAPWHYLTYHKAFHFDVQPLLDLGWKPRYSNDAMFRESWDWFVQNKDRIAAEDAASPHRSKVKAALTGFTQEVFVSSARWWDCSRNLAPVQRRNPVTAMFEFNRSAAALRRDCRNATIAFNLRKCSALPTQRLELTSRPILFTIHHPRRRSRSKPASPHPLSESHRALRQRARP